MGRTILCRALVGIYLACLINTPAEASETAHDGNWWLSLSSEEKDAFLSGFTDCYLFDAKGNRYVGKNRYDGREKVTEYYSSGDKNERFPSVFRKLSDPDPSLNKTERHTYFDGEFWRQLFTRTEKNAFVRGYIVCHVEYLHSQISHSNDFYVDALSSHYGTNDDDPGDAKEETINDKIGDVLKQIILK